MPNKPSKPTDGDIATYTRLTIAAHAGIAVEDSWKLRKDIGFDRPGLVYLTKSLRGYIQQHSDETLSVREVDKSNATVATTIALVQKKLQN